MAQLYEIYQQQIKAEVEQRHGGFTHDWPLEKLMQLHNRVSDLLAANRNRVNQKWNVTLIDLANIVLSERAQAKYETQWELWSKSKSKK